MEEIFALIAIALLVTLHIIVVVTLLGGPIVAITGYLRQHPRYERFYVTTIILTILSFVFTGACFLTTWEQQLRANYLPETAYTGGFISHYLNRLGLSITDDTVFWILAIAMVTGVLATFYHFMRSRISSKSSR